MADSAMNPAPAEALKRMRVRELGSPLRVVCEGSAHRRRGAVAQPESAEVERVWAELCAANPRLHDGHILQVLEVNAAAGEIVCAVGSYKLLSVAGRVPTGTLQLGVKGLVIGLDVTSRPHVLLGRRSQQTRLYGGMWEVAPGGGIDPPAALLEGNNCELSEADVLRELAKEGREELGIEIQPHDCRVVAVVRDEIARSEDVVVRVELPGTIDLACGLKGEHAWEYGDTRWVMLADLALFDADHAAEITPPTRAIFRWMGWVES